MKEDTSRLKGIVLIATIMISFGLVALITLLIALSIHSNDFTTERIIMYFSMCLGWLIIFSVLVYIIFKEINHYEEDSRSAGLDIMQALNSNFAAVFYVDFDNRVVKPLRVSKEIFDYFGFNPKQKVDFEKSRMRYAREFVVDEWREQFIEEFTISNIQKRLSENGYYSYIYKIENRGMQYFMQAKAARISESVGQIVVGFANVDAEIRADEEKKKIMKDALRSAEEANKAKTTFLTNMSHDIRTPLNAIMGFASIAAWHTKEPEKMDEYVQKIITSANQMTYLVNNVLDMSMIEGGAMELTKVPCNIRSIVQDVEIVVRSETTDKQQELIVNMLEVKHDSVLCDKVRLNRVLMNLLGNATKYTGKGGVISLTVKEISANNASATFSFAIKDTGIGMDQSYVNHMYEMFSRERTSTESGIPGVGLGLSITKKIVDLMGGTIDIATKKDEGTQFVVTLTFELSDEKVAFEEVKDSRKAPVKDEENAKHRILIAEDNELNLEILDNILVSNGYSVDRAVNGQEAVDMFKESEEGHYSMILMDIQMPVLDGQAATSMIRKMDRSDKDLPIIAITANAFSQDAADARQSGMNEHISKPINVEKLKDVLQRYIK